jgi:hypothetical protein
LKDDNLFLETAPNSPRTFEEGLDLKNKINALLYLGNLEKYFLPLFTVT